MWKRIVKRLQSDVPQREFLGLLDRIKQLREEQGVVTFYGTPTEGNWLGIANATRSIYGDAALALPQWYSKSRLDDRQRQQFCDTVRALNFDWVIWSGFPAYFLDLALMLGAKQPQEVIYHGTIAEFHSAEMRHLMGRMISMAQSGDIRRLAFIKTGMAEIFQKLYGLNCRHQPLPTPSVPKNINRLDLDKSKFHIGVFGGDTFNKNLHNQVIHALMIDHTVVHVLDAADFSYLQMGDRIIGHGKNLPRDTFMGILASMDLNLYMSFSESWGLVAYESEALGVPCLKSPDIDYVKKITDMIKAR